MVEISSINREELDSVLKTRGGFAWWYTDLMDHECNGFVLIWSWGLPFLPGSRALPIPSQRPSLNLAAYRRGRPDFYLLQQFPEDQALLRDAHGSAMMGATEFRVTSEGSRMRLLVEIDAQVPRSRDRAIGRLELTGPTLALPHSASASHQWSPQSMAARGSIRLQHGQHAFELDGSGYFDSNFSRVPLHEQGIQSWRWGRIAFDHETLVFYDVEFEGNERKLHLFRQSNESPERLESILADGLDWDEIKRGKYGVSFPRNLTVSTPDGDYSIRAAHVVDDGPFYQRLLLLGENPSGDLGQGIGEVVIPSRVDVPWQRPFVRMRTHRVGACNSPFLPFFCGASRDRMGRFMRTLAALGTPC